MFTQEALSQGQGDTPKDTSVEYARRALLRNRTKIRVQDSWRKFQLRSAYFIIHADAFEQKLNAVSIWLGYHWHSGV